jgi:23S rRNA (guanosine2251-2'-O)-methyltransferase
MKNKQITTEVFGWHAVLAALENPTMTLTRIYIANSRGVDARYQKVYSLARKENIPVESITKEHMNQRWGNDHQGIAAESSVPFKIYTEDDIEDLVAGNNNALILVLDEVQDPHNLGACMRSAAAANVTCVIAPKDNSASLTAAARKVACGAAEVIPFISVTNLARTLKKLQESGVWIYGMDHHATQSIYEVKFSGKVALVLGAEENGMRRLTRENCDELVKIPMSGLIESLNVSVAAGIGLFEIRRVLT